MQAPRAIPSRGPSPGRGSRWTRGAFNSSPRGVRVRWLASRSSHPSRTKAHAGPRSPEPRYRSFLTTALLLGSFAGQVSGQSPGTLVFTCLEIRDVNRGAGLAVVIETPGGKTYLYDTGNGYPEGDGWAGDYNAGRDTILPYLKGRGISSLDGVIISHAHYDQRHHLRRPALAGRSFPVARLYDAGYQFRRRARPRTPRSSRPTTGSATSSRPCPAPTSRPTRVTVTSSTADSRSRSLPRPEGFFTEAHPERRPKSDPPADYLVNANSLGIRIKHGEVVFLLPGDIQKEDQVQSLLPSIAAEKLRSSDPGRARSRHPRRPRVRRRRPSRGHDRQRLPALREASRPRRRYAPWARASARPASTAGSRSLQTECLQAGSGTPRCGVIPTDRGRTPRFAVVRDPTNLVHNPNTNIAITIRCLG